MSAFKPRKVAAASFFVTDQREEKKFWYLDPVVQPVVRVNDDGTFVDPAANVPVIEALPFLLAASQTQQDAIAGDANHNLGVLNEVWEIRSVTLFSAAGGNYAVEDDGQIVGPTVAVALGATEELVPVPLPLAGASVITINGGLGADAWNIRNVRL